MDIKEAVEKRHSVRQYLDKPIDDEKTQILEKQIEKCNQAGDLNIQLILNEPRAFQSQLAHYGKFKGVQHYIALIGKKNSSDLQEKCGYYGEHLVLLAQQLGLNTCWVALTYKKIPEVLHFDSDEKIVAVISIGYGENQGVARRSKDMKDVIETEGNLPQWFYEGVCYALLAPTAMNQQKFKFGFENGKVKVKRGIGFYTKLDLGIVKYHFEIGAGKNHFQWDNEDNQR